MIDQLDRIREALVARPRRELPLGDLRPAAVLLPLFVKNNEPSLLFTRRSDDLEHHSGEIAFPGGVREPQDVDLWQTALRETEEEMGIRPADVTLVGALDDFISVHGYRVTPYVGFFSWPYTYRVAAEEIAEVFEIPLQHFDDPAIYRREDWTHKGRSWPIHFYAYGSQQIWGLTAAILRQFLKRVAIDSFVSMPLSR